MGLKKLSLLLIIFFSLFFFSKNAFAQSSNEKFAVVVNPVRGWEFWNYPQKPLDTPKEQYKILKDKKIPATWLLRYDALKDDEMANFFKTLDSDQELGLFLEITPQLTKDSGVVYNQSVTWQQAKSIFLIGYSPADREKLISVAFEKFKSIYGYYPKSVGAWWIDAYSLDFMKEKYDISANLDVADQNSTDGYQVWGQYWSTPFYPSKLNAIFPAENQKEKIGVVTVQWATRDPFNGYGVGSYESTFSVQPNDYFIHKLDTTYFEKLLDIYPQTTVGLENDFGWKTYGQEYQKQMDILRSRQDSNSLKLVTMADFASIYTQTNPLVSPKTLIVANDPLGGGGKVVWYQTLRYRIGWFYDPNKGSLIRELREYDYGPENCFDKACETLNMEAASANALDDANFSTYWLIDEGKINDFEVIKSDNSTVEIRYKNQAGNERTIKFFENDIEVNGERQTITSAISKTREMLSKQNETKIQTSPQLLKLKEDWLSLTGNFFKFLVFAVLFFLLPGLVLSQNWFLAIPVGMALFTFANFVFGFVKADFLIWTLPIISAIRLYIKPPPKLKFPKFNLYNLAILVLIISGTVCWLTTVVKSGLTYVFGFGYWGPNGHDAVWHLSLISELQRNFPPQNPIFAGTKLSNYHYFFDLLLAKTGKLFFIDNQDLLFRFFPLLISILVGILMYKFVLLIFKNKIAAFFATFFLYFGGSWGWVVSYLKARNFGGESMFWAQQSISTLLNPPFAISLLLLISGLFLFLKFLKTGLNRSQFIALVILWGTLIEFKVYAGLLVLGALGIVSLYKILFGKKFSVFILFVSCFILSAIIFLPNNLTGTKLLSISPFWLVNSMIDISDRLGWSRLALARRSYFTTGNLVKFLGAETLGLFIFILGNFGTRVIGFFNPKIFIKTGFKEREILVFLIVIFLAGVTIPLIFIQEGNGWNIVQFFYYSLLILDLFVGVSLASLISWNKYVGFLLAALIVLLTIPTTMGNLIQYLPSRPPAKLSFAEMEALNFLKRQPSGIVMTLPPEQNIGSKFSEPVPLLAYTSTAYVSAFSNHPTFLEDTTNLEILGVDYKGRLNEQKDFVKYSSKSKEILKRNDIKYLYAPKILGFTGDEEGIGIKKIFENEEVKIFEVV